MGFFPFTVLWVIYYIMLFAALLHCTSYNGIFSGSEYLVRAGLDGSRRTRRFAQSISFAQDSTVRAGLDGSRRSRRFAQDSTVRAEYLVRAGLDGSRRTRRFAQVSTVRAGLDCSRRTRPFAQDSTVRAGLDGSRRQNSTVRAGLDGSRRTRPFWPLRRLIGDWFDKLEQMIVSRESDRVVEERTTTKKVGSLLGNIADLSRQKNAVTAFHAKWSL